MDGRLRIAILDADTVTKGDVSLDPTGKADGRGAYLCADPACLAKARKARRLERAFDRQIPPEIYDMLESKLTEAMK